MDLGLRTRFAGMTDITGLHRPRNLAIVAGAAILAINNFQHIDIVSACFELEAQIGMAYFATETDAMKPVREDNRAHTGCFRIVVDHDIPIFGIDRCNRDCKKD